MTTGGSIVIGRAPDVRPTIDASTISGPHGGFMWRGYRACDVLRYTVTRSAIEGGLRRWTVCGHVANVNTLNLSQRDLVFVAPHKLGKWFWPVIELHVADGVAVASLGAPITDTTVAQTAHVQRLVQQQQQRPLASAQLQRLMHHQRLTR